MVAVANNELNAARRLGPNRVVFTLTHTHASKVIQIYAFACCVGVSWERHRQIGSPILGAFRRITPHALRIAINASDGIVSYTQKKLVSAFVEI